MKLSFNGLLIGLCTIILTGIVVVGFMATQNSHSLILTAQQIETTHKILQATEMIRAIDDENESDINRYFGTGELAFIEEIIASRTIVSAQINKLELLMKHDVFQDQQIQALLEQVKRKDKFCDDVVVFAKQKGVEAAHQYFAHAAGKSRSSDVDKIITHIELTEAERLKQRQEANAKDIMSLQYVFLFIAISALVIVVTLYILLHISSTRKKKEEERLKESNQEISSILKNINDAFFSMNMITHRYISVSPACEKVYGYTVRDFFANPMIWKEVVHPDDTDLVDMQDERFYRNERVTTQYRIIHKDKNIRWVESKIIPTLDNEGRLVRIDVVVNDITERKKEQLQLEDANLELNKLFSAVDEVLYSVDMKTGQLTQMSPACEKVYGYTQSDFFSNADLRSELVHTEDTHLLEDQFTKLTSGLEVRNQYRIIHKNGTTRWIENIIIPTLDQRGSLARIDGVTRDFTGKKKAETEIRELNESLEVKVKELEILNKEVESFSYSVSHDLRAPLRVINGYSNMVLKSQKDKLDTQAQEDLQAIMTSAMHMGNLIDDLLAFSQLGKTSLVKNHMNMTDMVKVVIQEIKTDTHSLAEIKLNDFEMTDCDGPLMKQVWSNLISNAVKYSRKKERPLIEIGSTGLNGHQTYYIKDNGAGFDMEHSDKLFAVFQRLHKVSEYEGTGVGLALVQRIITRHGGKIWADAKINEGATFYFTLS